MFLKFFLTEKSRINPTDMSSSATIGTMNLILKTRARSGTAIKALANPVTALTKYAKKIIIANNSSNSKCVINKTYMSYFGMRFCLRRV